MSLFIASLNSGSNGNCYYIGNNREAVVIDAGISCRETEKRMRNLQLSMKLVKAVFISHEHNDHICGVESMVRRYKLPVYIAPAALKKSSVVLNKDFIRTFKAGKPVTIGGLSVTAFSKEHDAAEPYSFIVEGNGIRAGVFTDIGKPCGNVIHYFRQCHAAFLESNYDEEMLEKGRYSDRLKNRIRGGKGHLSNRHALELFITYRPEYMSHLFLSHLSKENNRPELALELFAKHAYGTHIAVAPRNKESPVYHITGLDYKISERKNPGLQLQAVQMSLFE